MYAWIYLHSDTSDFALVVVRQPHTGRRIDIVNGIKKQVSAA